MLRSNATTAGRQAKRGCASLNISTTSVVSLVCCMKLSLQSSVNHPSLLPDQATALGQLSEDALGTLHVYL